jgi:Flp pilus assembly protein TadD
LRSKEGAKKAGPPTGLIALVLVAGTVALFAGALPRTFINFDDDTYVTENPHVLAGVTAQGTAWALTTFKGSNWHPITWLSHMIDAQAFGQEAVKHHVVNLLLHATNVALLFLVLTSMTGAVWPSACAAALFAVHPLHVESFAWIAERKDVLSTAFWLLTTAAWLRYVRAPSAGAYALVVAVYAAGLMSKPMLVTLPFTLLLLDVWPLARGPFRRVMEKLPLFAMAAASSVVTAVAQRSGGALQSLTRYPLPGRVANALISYVAYLGKAVWPARLSVFYPYRPTGLTGPATIGAALALVAISAIAWRYRQAAPYALFGWLWYLGTLAPVIGIVQVGGQSMADRYMYVPSIGLFVALAWGAADLASRGPAWRTAIAAATVVVLAALGVASRAQLATWADRRTLFAHALDVTKDNWLAHGNLGNALLNDGEIDGAIAQFREAVRIDPRYQDAHYNLGLAMIRLGRRDEAIAELTRAIEINPNAPNARNNLGGVYAEMGRLGEALEQTRIAVALDPTSRIARFNMANVLAQSGRDPEAIEIYDALAREDPRDPETLDRLGLALIRVERWPQAIERFRQEARLRPGSSNVRESLGYSLARAGRMSEALQEFEEALRLDPRNEQAKLNAQKARAALGLP